MTTPTKEEQLLLDILGGDDPTEEPDDEGKNLDEHQRALLQHLLNASMPTPEEIMRSARAAEHNAEIDRQRMEKLKARRERRATLGRGAPKNKQRRSR